MLQYLIANLPDVAYIHQTRNLQSHILDCSLLNMHRSEKSHELLQKSFDPRPTVIISVFPNKSDMKSFSIHTVSPPIFQA